MKGSTERWVQVNDGKDVVANIWRTDKDFYHWATQTVCDWNDHPECQAVEEACFTKTQQKCKLYRVNRMQYVGYLLPAGG